MAFGAGVILWTYLFGSSDSPPPPQLSPMAFFFVSFYFGDDRGGGRYERGSLLPVRCFSF